MSESRESDASRAAKPLPRLYAILDTDRLQGRPLELVCETLLAAGVRWFQYRDKQGTSRRIFEAATSLLPVIHAAGGRLIVNDRADVALVSGADGVHLGRDDLTVEEARRVLKPGQIVGWSTHNMEQLRQADASRADYLAFGPIFATGSKQRPDPVVGLDGLARARQATSKPLVAIGGIAVENARAVIEHGADAVAVIAGLLSAPDLAARAREFLEVLGEGTGVR
ncbi:MAG TPA: thiamine phosphate synthase [Terriglobia bacterium]|nr:thiamine phosphate synthase [Terriglobia bacterium]